MACNNSVFISNMTDVWNATGNYKVAVQMDVTDISSAPNSRLLDLLLNGISQFSVDKNGCIQTDCADLWLTNTSNHGFGANSLVPSVYYNSGVILTFDNTNLYPQTSQVYDLGKVNKLFHNIYQTTISSSTPSTSDYVSSGAWGVHHDAGNDNRYVAYNNGGSIETIQFGAKPISVSDEGSSLVTSASSFNFVGAGVTATNSGNNITVTIPGASGGGGSGTPLSVLDEGSSLHSDVASLNFVGVGVTATNIGNAVTVTIPGGSGGSGISTVNTTLPITGDGVGSNVGLLLSVDANNAAILGSDSGIYVASESGNILEALDEGSSLVNNVSSLNFVGAGVTATNIGTAVTVTIPGGSGGGSGTPLEVQNDGIQLHPDVTVINFTGEGVTASNAGSVVTVNISGGGTDTFTNSTPMPEDVGGLVLGTTFNNDSLTGVFDRLLYPYQTPTFTSFSFNAGGPKEVGDSVTTGTYSFTWATTNTGNISGNVVNIEDLTNSAVIISGTPNDGTGNFAIPTSTKSVTGVNTWRISAFDTSGNPFWKDFDVEWQHRLFYGESASGTLNETQVEALRVSQLDTDPDNTYIFLANGYKYIAYPTGMGQRTLFLDIDSDINVDMNTGYIQNLTNSFAVSNDYYVYRTQNQFASGINIQINQTGSLGSSQIVQGGASAIETLDEGSSLTSSTSSLNFVGSGVTATTVGNDVTVTVPGLQVLGTGDIPFQDVHIVTLQVEDIGGAIVDNMTGTQVGTGYMALDLDSSDVTSYDPFNLINTGDNSITITNPGTYKLRADGKFNGGVTGPGTIAFKKNGSTNVVALAGSYAINAEVSLLGSVDLEAGDKLEFSCVTNTIEDFDGAIEIVQLSDATVFGGGFDPLSTHTFGVQQYEWTPMTNEAVIDITGSSPSQTTTLTANRTMSFTGTMPANKDRVYYAEVTPSGNTLSISSGNDPGSLFTQPSYSPFVVAFKILSDGTPRFAGLI